ncbi:MAG TPA: hypothetical protein VHF22_15195 [Planctomycetota bacterium]|nr:hypothetical protein [Planctomycetota bacterium]
MRFHIGLVLALVLALAGCFSEPPRVEAPKPPPENPNRLTLRLAMIPAPRVKGSDAASKRRLEEAVGVASSVLGLDAVVFGGDLIANEDAKDAADALDAFTSLAGIIAAKRYVVLGERERAGALPEDEVLRALEAKKLVPDRSGNASEVVKPGVRLLLLDVAEDGSVSEATRKFALAALKARTPETLIVVVADRPPLDAAVQEAMRADARVKLVLFRAARPEGMAQPGEVATVSAPPLDTPGPLAIRVIDIDGRTCKTRLLAVPGGGDAGAPQELKLR